MSRTNRVSIRDVARAASVSTTTVSDALSGQGRLSQATRDRVSKVAAELGYTANPNARWLRSGRTGAVGLYLPESVIGLEYYMRLALGATDEAFTHGLALTLVPTWRDGADPPALHLDGVVVSDPVLGDPMLARLSSLGVPVVTCERDVTPGAVHAGLARGDHRLGVTLLLDHLAAQGATRIAMLCSGDDTAFGQDIRAAHRDWCADHDLPHLMYEVPFAVRPEQVTDAVNEALHQGPPDALVTVPDGSLAPAWQALHTARLSVPDDLLLASYVDSSALVSMPVPVTAVDLAPREMGQRAVRLLADLVEGRTGPGQTVDVPVRLQVRASTSVHLPSSWRP